jgi:hypothetical protein
MARLLICALALALWPMQALAFGTTNSLGQNAEHERITRAALPDLGPRTLDELAGKRGTFGAVGAPDNPLRGLMSEHAAHCDGGDFLASPPAPPGYPQTEAQAQAMLTDCRDWIVRWLDAAVTAAAPLAEPTAEQTELPCSFRGEPERAKCAVIEYMGVAFHAAQDFYAHSNWVDRPADRAISARNPPGLGHEDRAPWLDPRGGAGFPTGLISGCYEGFPEWLYCRYDGHVRVRHSVLNKDTGPIGPEGATGPGSTDRGAINGNFERAVAAAIEDTRDKWLYFEQRVLETYGEEAGRRIICVVRNDDYRNC